MCSAWSRQLGDAINNRYPTKESSKHVAEQIYNRFPSETDVVLMENIHLVPWENRSNIIEQLND